MSDLHLEGIVKRYGNHTVVDGLDFSVASGEFVSLLGPSGCGKTTLLRIIAGLAECDGGSVRVGNADITRLPAHKRNIGVVFQNYALFPHLTVGENVAFGLKARRTPATEVAPRVADALESVQLAAYADRSISALSGGQQQRVAVARAIATRPRVLLLDEPLSALDRKLRETMQIELRQILRGAGMTAIFVTHDQEEALVMSDRIAVMNAGRIEQFDSPEAIYARPATEFALNFVGLSSQWPGTVERCEGEQMLISTACGAVLASRGTSEFRVGDSVLVGVRPERIALTGVNQSGIPATFNRMSAKIGPMVFRGANRLVYCQSGDAPPLLAEVPGHADAGWRTGDAVELSWAPEDTLVFARARSRT